MGDTSRQPTGNDAENVEGIPLPPLATDQSARMGDWSMYPIGDANANISRNEQLRQYYHDGSNTFYARPWDPNQNAWNGQNGQENVDLRLYDDFSEDNSTLERYQSAENLQRLYPQLDTSDNRRQNESAADEEYRYWAANSPVARNLQRVLSDGSFDRPRGTNTDHGAHWNDALPASPLGQVHADQMEQNDPQLHADRQTDQIAPNPTGGTQFEPARTHSN